MHQNPTSNSDLHPTPEEVIWLGQAVKVAENQKDVLIGYVCSDNPFCWMLIMKRHAQQLLVLTLCCARKKKRLVVRPITHKVFFSRIKATLKCISICLARIFFPLLKRQITDHWWICPPRHGHLYTYLLKFSAFGNHIIESTIQQTLAHYLHLKVCVT